MENRQQEQKPGVIEAIGTIVAGLGILAAIDYFLGEIWAFFFITMGVFGTFYGGKITASGILKLINQTGTQSIKDKMAMFWYDANVSPHSSDRIANPTPEEIHEYIRFKEYQERLKQEEVEKTKSESKEGKKDKEDIKIPS